MSRHGGRWSSGTGFNRGQKPAFAAEIIIYKMMHPAERVGPVRPAADCLPSLASAVLVPNAGQYLEICRSHTVPLFTDIDMIRR